eukprot:1857498-Pyramimonas_sp.AAC.1
MDDMVRDIDIDAAQNLSAALPRPLFDDKPFSNCFFYHSEVRGSRPPSLGFRPPSLGFPVLLRLLRASTIPL